jgi:hypothetical protein
LLPAIDFCEVPPFFVLRSIFTYIPSAFISKAAESHPHSLIDHLKSFVIMIFPISVN